MQQNGIGVWFGSEETIAEVEVVGECLRQLVGAAVFLVLVSLYSGLWRLSLCGAVLVRVSGPNAILLLGLHGNQRRVQS